jgi:hypothetical protein
MNSEEFVKRIQAVVYHPSIQECLSLLEKPPGRRPSAALVELSGWYRQLSSDDKQQVRAIIQLAVRAAVFEMLTVLDGVTSIKEAGEKTGTLELRYITEDESVLLNGPSGEFLHDLFAQRIPPE